MLDVKPLPLPTAVSTFTQDSSIFLVEERIDINNPVLFNLRADSLSGLLSTTGQADLALRGRAISWQADCRLMRGTTQANGM